VVEIPADDLQWIGVEHDEQLVVVEAEELLEARGAHAAKLPARLRYGRPEAMYQRRRHRESTEEEEAATPPRRGAEAVLALQRMIGNRGTTRVIARDRKRSSKKKVGGFERSVTIEKLGRLEITGGNIDDWKTKILDDLQVTTRKGDHSEDLKKMADAKGGTKLKSLEVTVVTGENVWMKITFTPARIVDYSASADGKTESWRVVDFQGVHREQTSIGTAR
jgi:hypothetical protein